MLFKNPKAILSEAASADLLNPEVSDEVKEVMDDLEDILTNNIEEVDEKDKTTNGGIPVVAESVALMESAVSYGEAKYLLRFDDLFAVMEAAAEAEAEAQAEPGEAPTPEAIDAAMPEPENVIDDIATKNGVEPSQVAVVITAESFRHLARNVMLEAKVKDHVTEQPVEAENAKKLKQKVEVAKKVTQSGKCKTLVSNKKGCKK